MGKKQLSDEYTLMPRPPDPVPSYPTIRPKDASTLIILRKHRRQIQLLMGRRHPGHKFMPNKFVFPGGRVDSADSRVRIDSDLDPVTREQLLIAMKGRASENRARAIALAAIRETFEETGLVIGKPVAQPQSSRSTVWQNFLAHGISPDLGNLKFFARAITPPKRRRRYDTRFFCVSADHIAVETGLEDGELLDLHWLSIKQALDLDIPPITKTILNDLRNRLDGNGELDSQAPVPFYYMASNGFRRRLISLPPKS
ncbi:MAG: NUDIX hydrolase [Methyloligellaceae bacterium]